MKFTITLLLFTLLFSLRLSAQNVYSVKGDIVDTAENAKLLNASISVLNAKDSTLVSFTRAAGGGAFSIGNLHKGKFILLVSYPTYADYVEQFSLDSIKSGHDFGKLNMLLKAKLLRDVIIRGTRSAMKIKGDTTEYNAGAFKVQPNAKVEDLLKQLPGIEVDKDGKITAQGQTVNKVLVDGEEFFGDDPTLVTKNIRADMVDKVQLYDKKSDQATFTGIDDGQKTKTINIKLKEDKKNGYFGKIDAGDATDGYYEGQLLFNRFKAKQKFSAYLTVGNNGKTGLGWEDSQKYGSDALQFGDNGEIFITGGNGDGLDSFNGQYNGQGTPLARNGGLHYDSKWNGDKESINANYKIGSLEVNGTNNTLTQNNTTDGTYNGTSNQNFDNFMFRQKLDFTYQIKLDTTSNLKIMADGTLKNTHTRSNYLSTSLNGVDTLQNGSRKIDNKDNTQQFDASAFYTKKFKKKGRTLSFLAGISQNETTSNGYLYSKTAYYNPIIIGKIDSLPIVDQYKTADVKSASFKTNLTYTEPLTKDFSVIFNYGLGVNNGTSNLASFNQSSPGDYSLKVGNLSDDYKLDELSNQAGAVFNYKKNKAVFNFGTKVSNVNFNQTDLVTGATLKRDFIDWMPQANFQYRFSQQQSLYVNYSGRTEQPTISQIQPVTVNSDPHNITIGNPNLTPSFSNNFYFYYNSYKILSGQSIWLNGNYSFTTNPIVSNLVTSTNGNTVNQYVNIGNKTSSNYNLNAYLDRKLGKTDINIGLNAGLNGNSSYNYSNNALDYIKSDTYSLKFQTSKYKEKKYDLYLNFGPNYTISGSSLQPQINNNGRGFNAAAGFTFYLPGKFQIASDGNYENRGKTETFNTVYTRTLINASLAKTFLKEDNLKLSISGNDLLNQNSGFDRNSSGNLITQNTYTTIKRYFMLSIVWDFNKMGGITKK
ncbi:outer membrane beta-barrel family protein [Mucilaginibacter sp.]|uniref:outer membrane beta-barrel family protein n=1 Tax=Mucilaginibacter sp. TaxID=1882438 RepID=UPI0028424E5E|nr:outer membrane beta-barrel family protein [Mucilaginibacter sp.]MDR3695255.1 outer membrane beta-barrel family protein [Mucilaginibacter sp.]